mgnify:CR=1 FL=1
MPRKHLIVGGIVKKQQQQAKIWMKIARDIKASARVGGPNIDANPRLKAAVDKAIQNNLSRESIQKNINSSIKDKSLLEDFEFEAYGPNGLAIIIKALCDNNNRIISSLRGYLNKIPASLSKINTAKTSFRYLGEIILNKKYLTEDLIFEKIIDFPVLDLIENDDCFQVIVEEKNFYLIRDTLKDANFDVIDSGIRYIPINHVNLNQAQFDKLTKFLENCENDDDIQDVYTNFGQINIEE